MDKLLFSSLAVFLLLSSLASAQSFADRVIMSPDVAFIWNFQRGVEEVYRFAKFSTAMRVQYSLELMERRIGEIEVLANKSKEEFIPMVENIYEIEADKIVREMATSDVVSIFVDVPDIRENVTQRLRQDSDALKELNTYSIQKETQETISKAIEKTTLCIDQINRL